MIATIDENGLPKGWTQTIMVDQAFGINMM
jgi:hypothetical protein